MKTAIELIMTDKRTGITASCAVWVDVDWQPLDAIHCHDGSMDDFRPTMLESIGMSTDKYIMRHVPYRGPEPNWVERLISSLQRKSRDLRESL